jgi:hypothetical protein
MYETEKQKIKYDLHSILNKTNDKNIIVDDVLFYIKNNINIIWDVVNNKD